MHRYLAYIKYIFRHKFFVFKACRLLGVSWWRGVLHDWTKFLPREFFPYACYFYQRDGSKRIKCITTNSNHSEKLDSRFEYAWLLHQRNKHHFQAWIVIGTSGSCMPLPMPHKYIFEMIADWVGAGLAIDGNGNPSEWYRTNKDKMILHADTRRKIEEILSVHFGYDLS